MYSFQHLSFKGGLQAMDHIFIDSDLPVEEALKQNPAMPCPAEILAQQEVVRVCYVGFDNNVHQGQIVVDRRLVGDVIGAFDLLLGLKFPITSVIPVSRYSWSDEASMQADNSSGFNYRLIAGTGRPSLHGSGWAIDINPRRNPYINGDDVQPKGAVYLPGEPGVFTDKSDLVSFLESRGWIWGGRWTSLKDYQHFEKRLS